MARRYRLREIENKYGDLHRVIPDLVNKQGQAETARELDVTQATISIWLKENGYKRIVQWVRETAKEN